MVWNNKWNITISQHIATKKFCWFVEAEARTSDKPWLFVPLGVLCGEDVHCAVVAGHADEGGILVEIDAGQWGGGDRQEGGHTEQLNEARRDKHWELNQGHRSNAKSIKSTCLADSVSSTQTHTSWGNNLSKPKQTSKETFFHFVLLAKIPHVALMNSRGANIALFFFTTYLICLHKASNPRKINKLNKQRCTHIGADWYIVPALAGEDPRLRAGCVWCRAQPKKTQWICIAHTSQQTIATPSRLNAHQ